MCRSKVTNAKIEEKDVFKFLLNDAQSDNQPYQNFGYSVMLFEVQTGKVAGEGDLKRKFFDKYSQI